MKIEIRGQKSEIRDQRLGCRLSSGVPSSLREFRRAGRRLASSSGWRLSSGVWRLAAAFTLVELLVVISIIAILLGIIVPSYFSIREKAKYTKAKVTVKNLETAFKSYLDHYRVWPSVFVDDNTTLEIKDDIYRILIGEKVGDDNKDNIPFYEFESTNSTDGALDPFTDSTTPPIQMQYRVRVDANYDNKIAVGGQDLYRTVLVWSVGTNRSDGLSEPATKEGNVKSWD